MRPLGDGSALLHVAGEVRGWRGRVPPQVHEGHGGEVEESCLAAGHPQAGLVRCLVCQGDLVGVF